MKRILMFLAIGTVLVSNATVYTVNNQNGFVADFTTLPAAISAALNDDTLYVQPSSVGYGDIVLNKRLYLIGGGHNPEFSPYTSSIGVINISQGAAGSIIKGVNIWYITTPTSITVNDIVISGCQIVAQNPLSLGAASNFNNWIFEGNIISSQTNGISCQNLGANAIFRNNVLHVYAGDVIIKYVPNGTLFDHNLFLVTDNNSFGGIFNNSSNVSVTNNILHLATATNAAPATGCSSCTWQNNITYNPNASLASLPGTNFNNSNPEFVNVPSNGGWYSYANDYHLATTSPGHNAATDGTDVGLYGGYFSFSPFGFDAGTPRVGDFTILTPSAPAGGSITIHLKAHGSGQ